MLFQAFFLNFSCCCCCNLFSLRKTGREKDKLPGQSQRVNVNVDAAVVDGVVANADADADADADVVVNAGIEQKELFQQRKKRRRRFVKAKVLSTHMRTLIPTHTYTHTHNTVEGKRLRC